MGKGDKKTKRGKITIGSYGVRRKKKDSIGSFEVKPKVSAKKTSKAESPEAPKAKKAPAKKAVKE
jgi:30S ribosomal protein S31